MEIQAKDGENPEWVSVDFSKMFDGNELQGLINSMLQNGEVFFSSTVDRTTPASFEFPDFGANRLCKAAQNHLCDELAYYTRRTVSTVSDMPSVLLIERRAGVWKRVLVACEGHCYSEGNLRKALQAQASEQDPKENETEDLETSAERKSSNEVLLEIGVKSALRMMFTLLQQAWGQLAWQRQLEKTLITSSLTITTPFRAPTISLPNEVLRSVLEILKAIPPLSFSNHCSLSKLSQECLKTSTEFLLWVLSPESLVDAEGKRLAAETVLTLTLHYGVLHSLLEWVDKMLACLASYHDREGEEGVGPPLLSKEFCDHALEELRSRTVSWLRWVNYNAVWRQNLASINFGESLTKTYWQILNLVKRTMPCAIAMQLYSLINVVRF